MQNRQSYDNIDPEIEEEALEEAATKLGMSGAEADHDLATEAQFDTQHDDGHTYNPVIAQEQGLTYTPPTDPPTMPSDDPQGIDIATGFATSMEESSPDEEVLPERVDNNDLELANDVREALRLNSETAHLDDIEVRVESGVVTLLGTVQSNDDLPRVDDIVTELAGVVEVILRLDVDI